MFDIVRLHSFNDGQVSGARALYIYTAVSRMRGNEEGERARRCTIFILGAEHGQPQITNKSFVCYREMGVRRTRAIDPLST